MRNVWRGRTDEEKSKQRNETAGMEHTTFQMKLKKGISFGKSFSTRFVDIGFGFISLHIFVRDAYSCGNALEHFYEYAYLRWSTFSCRSADGLAKRWNWEKEEAGCVARVCDFKWRSWLFFSPITLFSHLTICRTLIWKFFFFYGNECVCQNFEHNSWIILIEDCSMCSLRMCSIFFENKWCFNQFPSLKCEKQCIISLYFGSQIDNIEFKQSQIDNLFHISLKICDGRIVMVESSLKKIEGVLQRFSRNV